MKGILWLELLNLTKLPTPRYPDTPEAPHVTLQYNCDYEDYKAFTGQIVICRLHEEYYNDRVQAVRVEICDPKFAQLCKNPVPHVNISKQPDAFFAESNNVYYEATKHDCLFGPQWIKTVVFFQPFELFKHATPGTYRPTETTDPLVDPAGQNSPSYTNDGT